MARQLVILIMFLFSAQLQAQQKSSNGKTAKLMTSNYGRTGTLFDVGIYYGQSEATANPVSNNEFKSIISIYDIKLGYVFSEGYFLGAGYSARNESSSTTSSATTTGGAGMVGLGYFSSNGFNLRSYYHFNESFGDYKVGSGFQADLEYKVNMSSNFYMGIAFSHRQITYTQNNLITGFTSWIRKESYPFVTFGFIVN